MLSLLLADRKYKIASAGEAAAKCRGSKDEDDISYNHVSDYAPFFEIDSHWQQLPSSPSNSGKMVLAESVRKNHDRLRRRVFNTHLRWDMLPKRRKVSTSSTTQEEDGDNARSSESSIMNKERPQCGKFIYITRNQIDVVASFYHHLSNQKEGTYTDTFETFVQDWMEGKIPFGSSLDHLMSFAAGFADNLYDTSSSHDGHEVDDCDETSNQDQPLLLLSYERMKSNLQTEVLRIISFLNLTHIPLDVLTDELLPSFEFNSMKNDIDKFQPKSVGWLNGFQFLRRGVTGDGRRLMLITGGDDCNDNSGDGEREGESSELMDAYNDWVEREKYRSKISSLLQADCYEECREVFLSVVEMK